MGWAVKNMVPCGVFLYCGLHPALHYAQMRANKLKWTFLLKRGLHPPRMLAPFCPNLDMSICPTLDWQWVAPHTNSPLWTKFVNTPYFLVWKIPNRAYLYSSNKSLSRACKTFLNGQFGNLCRVHPTKVNIPNTTLWITICTLQPRLWGATHNVPLVDTDARTGFEFRGIITLH